MEDYLKAAYRLKMDGKPATTQLLADELGVSGPSVTNMVKRLDEMRLLRHTRYQGVELTAAGEKIALEVVRHHRLAGALSGRNARISLGSRCMTKRKSWSITFPTSSKPAWIHFSGYPTRDPHGDPIPTRDGLIPEDTDLPLAELADRTVAIVVRVSDRDPVQLRYLAELGLIPGAQVTIVERLPFDELTRIEVGESTHVIGRQLSRSVWVERPE